MCTGKHEESLVATVQNALISLELFRARIKDRTWVKSENGKKVIIGRLPDFVGLGAAIRAGCGNSRHRCCPSIRTHGHGSARNSR